MTTKQLIKEMNKLGYYVENLEPEELNIISKDPKTYNQDGWSEELVDIDIAHRYSFCLEYHVPKKVVSIVYDYTNTPLQKRHVKQAHIMQ